MTAAPIAPTPVSGRRFPDSFVRELVERTPLEQIAADYLDLKPAGPGRVKACCPIHSEKSPSFTINVDWNRFHCFGCGADGDVIDFLIQVDGLRFTEAVSLLAERSGVPVPDSDGADNAEKARDADRIRGALAAAAPRLQQWLLADDPAARTARDFLRQRGFTGAHAEQWGIGYNPPTGRALSDALAANGIPLDDQTAAGLTGASDRGVYDVYRSRLVWSLQDPQGRIIGFAGRDLTGNSKQKYVNTKGTDLYRKGSTLFGFAQARTAMLRTKQVHVVEGYTDVMAMVDAGFTNTVASSGTAFGSEQAALLLSRIGDGGEIVTAFDNDTAGHGAAWSVFLACQHFTSNITAVDFADYGGKADPCEVRSTAGNDELRRLVEQKRPVLQMLLSEDVAACDLTTPEGKVSATNAVTSRLSQVASGILRREYQKVTAAWIGVDTDDVNPGQRTPAPTPAAVPDGETVTAAPMPRDTESDSELQLAALLIADPRYIQVVTDYTECTLSELLGARVADIVELSAAVFESGRPAAGADATFWGEFMGQEVPEPDRKLLWRIAFTPAAMIEDAEDLTNRVYRRRLGHRIGELNALLGFSTGDEQMTVLAQIADATRKLRRLTTG